MIHAFLGQTVVASGGSTYIAADQLTAINLAATVGPDHKATVIPRFPAWPSITKYVNDNGRFADVVPEYIWDSTTTDNQVRAFAALSGGVGSQVSPVTMSVSLTVFADNAHIARIDVYDFSGSSPAFVETLTPPVLTDGSLDANTGLIETPPYNWTTPMIDSQHGTQRTLCRPSIAAGSSHYQAIFISKTIIPLKGFPLT
ncbi:hypothetical protein ABEX25_14755 [Paenibacillus thiaminolyticus]|uniref:hypothetical protein n=1 Tax=Paenibacillus thiaminolyticus TaxID=49283 RepID=UPI003D2C77AA